MSPFRHQYLILDPLQIAFVSEVLIKPFLFQCGGPDVFFGLPNYPLVRVGDASQLVLPILVVHRIPNV